MTETQKAAMQAALDAFQVATTPLAKDRQEVLAAIKALRAALAEPAEISDVDLFACDLCGKAIPEGVDPWHFSTHTSRHNHACDECVDSVPIFKPQQSAEPVVEPFGHVTIRRLSQRFENHADQYQFYPAGHAPYTDNVDECIAVYTSPPPPAEVPLKQIAEALRQHGLTLIKKANGYDVMQLGNIEAQEQAAVRQKAGLK